MAGCTVCTVGLAGCGGLSGSGDETTAPGDSGGNGGDGGNGGNGGNGNGGTGNGNGGSDVTPDEGSVANAQSQFRDVELPVDDSELRRGAPKDGIPAITEPAFASQWEGNLAEDQTFTLNDGDDVIGVTRDGSARAYPLRILNWHEVVNDDFGGPLLVTFCPLCGSAINAVRKVNGEETTFGVSGFLFRNDLVMYDQATDSLWSQIMATAIQGELTGDTLQITPSTTTTWGEWRDAHPDTEVLLPPPKSGTITGARPRNYARNPYAGYENTDRIGIGGDNPDDRLDPKTRVIGVSADGVSRAYPKGDVESAGVVNDTVGDLPVVVTVSDGGTLVAYVRRLDGETVTFEREGSHLVADGSRFRPLDGVAIDGPHEGTRLEQANEVSPEFWFAWADFHPETEIWEP